MKRLVMVLVILAVLGVGFHLHFRKQAQERRVEEEARLAECAKAEDIFRGIREEAAAAEKTSEAVKPLVATASACLKFVTGSDRLGTEEPPVRTSTRGPADSSKPKAPASAAELKAPAPPEQPRRPETKPRRDGDAPAGVMSKEELEAMRQKKQVKPEPARVDSDAQEPSGQEAAKGEPAPRKPDPPRSRDVEIMTLGRQVLDEADSIEADVQKVRELVGEAEVIREGALAARSSLVVAGRVAKLASVRSTVRSVAEGIGAMLARAESSVKRMAAIRDEVDRERKEQAEAERRRREAEALKALTAREEKAAEELCQKAAALVRGNRFSNAVETLTVEIEAYKTEPAREKIRRCTDRFTRVLTLHKYLIARIAAEPYRWGWGKGVNAKDVLDADPEGITITGGARTEWPDVDLDQMRKFIDHYATGRGMKVREQAELRLSVAILLSEHGLSDVAARQAQQCIDLAPYLEPEVKRLLPTP